MLETAVTVPYTFWSALGKVPAAGGTSIAGHTPNEAERTCCVQTLTLKREAFNRAASATLSNSISYSRTFTGRLSAQILCSNNGIDRAVKKKLWTVSGTSLCIWAQKRLQKISNGALLGKSLKKTNQYKKKRQTIRARLEYQHRAMQERGYPEPDYVKGLLDNNIHTYAQRPK